MKKKKFLALSFIAGSIFSMQRDLGTSQPLSNHLYSYNNEFLTHDTLSINPHYYLIDKSFLFIPRRLGNVSLYYCNNEFYIKNETKLVLIQRCFIDTKLRGIAQEKLNRLLSTGAHLSVNLLENEDYTLKL